MLLATAGKLPLCALAGSFVPGWAVQEARNTRSIPASLNLQPERNLTPQTGKKRAFLWMSNGCTSKAAIPFGDGYWVGT